MSKLAHLEIKVTQLPRAKKFYSKLFAWKFTDAYPGYTLFQMQKTSSGLQTGALDLVKTVAKRNATCPYFEVKDITKTLKSAKKLGGKIVNEKTALPDGMGFMGHFVDSEGNTMGLWSEK